MTELGTQGRARESGGMKAMLLILALMGALAVGLVSCYPTPVCTPSNTSCLPCNNPQTTNPACASFPNDDAKRRPDAGSADAPPTAMLSGGVPVLSGDVTALSASLPDLIVTATNTGGDVCPNGMRSVTPMAPGAVCLLNGLPFSFALCRMKFVERADRGKFSGSGDPWAEAIIDLMHRLPDGACGQAIDAMDASEPNCPTDSVLGCCGPDHRVGCFTSGGRYIGPLIHHYFPRYETQNEREIR